MNALTATNQLPAKTVLAECSPALRRLLTAHSLPHFEVTDEIANHAIIRAEVAAAMPALEREAAPCGPKAVVAVLAPLVTLYGVSDKSEAEWKAFWGFYVDIIGELPIEAVRAGVRDYVADPTSEFFPKPGPLKAICARHATDVLTAISRARRALSIEPKRQRAYVTAPVNQGGNA